MQACTVSDLAAYFSFLLADFLEYYLKVIFYDLGGSLFNKIRVELVNSIAFAFECGKVSVELLGELLRYK